MNTTEEDAKPVTRMSKIDDETADRIIVLTNLNSQFQCCPSPM